MSQVFDKTNSFHPSIYSTPTRMDNSNSWRPDNSSEDSLSWDYLDLHTEAVGEAQAPGQGGSGYSLDVERQLPWKFINLYNVINIIHRENMISFQQLNSIFRKVYEDMRKALQSLRNQYSRLRLNLYNFHFHGRYFHTDPQISIIVRDISILIFEKRRRQEMLFLQALRNYIVDGENYLNFYSKFLSDFFHTVTHGYSFNLLSVASRQKELPSKNTKHLDTSLTSYEEMSHDFLMELKND